MTPSDILKHLGFRLPQNDVDINPHDAWLYNEALRLAGSTIDVDAIPYEDLLYLDQQLARMSLVLNRRLGEEPRPSSSNDIGRLKGLIRCILKHLGLDTPNMLAVIDETKRDDLVEKTDDFSAKTLLQDRALFQKLGLPTFEDIPCGKQHYIGRVKCADGAYAKIWVTPAPAQFFQFEVFNPELEQTVNFSTGSGSLAEFWPIAKLIMDGGLAIDSVFTNDSPDGVDPDIGDDEGSNPAP